MPALHSTFCLFGFLRDLNKTLDALKISQHESIQDGTHLCIRPSQITNHNFLGKLLIFNIKKITNHRKLVEHFSENRLCTACFRLPLTKLESKRAANLCFHLCKAVREWTVSYHGCELVELSSVKATTLFFSRDLSFECHLPPAQLI